MVSLSRSPPREALARISRDHPGATGTQAQFKPGRCNRNHFFGLGRLCFPSYPEYMVKIFVPSEAMSIDVLLHTHQPESVMRHVFCIPTTLIFGQPRPLTSLPLGPTSTSRLIASPQGRKRGLPSGSVDPRRSENFLNSKLSPSPLNLVRCAAALSTKDSSKSTRAAKKTNGQLHCLALLQDTLVEHSCRSHAR